MKVEQMILLVDEFCDFIHENILDLELETALLKEQIERLERKNNYELR